ncbi:hypothetical protein [Kluyvera genomosp. 1]|uniref:hypothetical protein n=1 Tax=Kluyvera genomosp. 1 TaxID=2774053 RepID=UPI0012E30B96|nr:hypothetical protein [Kluyvera genomosp. 1]
MALIIVSPEGIYTGLTWPSTDKYKDAEHAYASCLGDASFANCSDKNAELGGASHKKQNKKKEAAEIEWT